MMSRPLCSVLAVLFLAAGGILLVNPFGGAFVNQPISYNHKKHIENGLECNACHQTVQTAAVAGRPELETCLLCHETPLTDSPEEEKIRHYAETGRPIPWRRVFKLPSHVYFSHRRHVVAGGLECKACHGDMAQVTEPPTSDMTDLSMENCISCHTVKGASTDCNACHK